MNQQATELVVVLDKSGSMMDRRAETVHALNKFIEEQKLVPGQAWLTLVTFNYRPEPFYNAMPLEMVPSISAESYMPDGYTALLDAVGLTIDRVGARLAGIPERERPGKVVFLVITDGAENISRKFTKADVLAKIRHQKAKYNWQFLYLGADAETFAEAGSMGVTYSQTMSWEPQAGGIMRAMVASNNAVSHFRNGDVAEATYSANDRALNNSK